MSLLKKTLWSLNIATIVLSVVYGVLVYAASSFHASYLIYALLYFGLFVHISTFIIVLQYTPERIRIQLRTLFFIVISLLFLIYTLAIADDPRIFSHITIFLNIITVGIAGSFIMNNSNVLQIFSYRSIIHFFYWFFVSCIAFTFLFNIDNPIWISIINWIIGLTIVTVIVGIAFIPPADKEQ